MIFIFLLLVIVGSGLTVSFLFMPANIFILCGLGIAIGSMSMFMITSLFGPRIFYYRLRLYEDREGDGVYVEHDVRARKIKGKDGYDYLETPTGQRYRFPGLKYFHSGEKGQLFGDVFRGAGTGKESQLFPIIVNAKNKHEIEKKIIPVEQRAWFSDTRVLGYIKEATKMPMDTKMQLLNTAVSLGVVMLIAVTLLFYPMYAQEMEEISKQKMAALASQHEELAKIYDNQPIVCQYEVVSSQPEIIVPPAIIPPS